jgi:hypothetical protein
MVRDLMLEAVEQRFGTTEGATRHSSGSSDNGSPYTAKETLDFAAASAWCHASPQCIAQSRTGSPKPFPKPSSATTLASIIAGRRYWASTDRRVIRGL